MTTRPSTFSVLRRLTLAALVLGLALGLGACRQDMHDQPKLEVYEASGFWEDGKASRDFPANTVPRSPAWREDAYHTGYTDEGQLVDDLPEQAIEDALSWDPDPRQAFRKYLERGQVRYEGFCSPCHDSVGNGNGMIVRRGFYQAASFHDERVRNLPDGHFFDAITNGFGQMNPYAAQISVEDRWAIVAYIRALQASQGTPAGELSDADRERLAEAIGGEPPTPAATDDASTDPATGAEETDAADAATPADASAP